MKKYTYGCDICGTRVNESRIVWGEAINGSYGICNKCFNKLTEEEIDKHNNSELQICKVIDRLYDDKLIKCAKKELKFLKKLINGKGWYYITKKYRKFVALNNIDSEQADLGFDYCAITINRHRNKAYIGYAWVLNCCNTELAV